MKKLVLASLVALASMPLSATAGAIDEVMKSGVLRVCTPGDYKPFSFALPDGRFEGIDVDLTGSLADALGVKVAFVKTTWANLPVAMCSSSSRRRLAAVERPRPSSCRPCPADT